MATPVDLSLKTPEMHQGIFDTFLGEGIDVESIENPNGEMLGVLARKVMNPAEILGSIVVHDIKAKIPVHGEVGASALDEMYGLRNTLPVAGSNVYPKHFLDLLDVIAQSASGQEGLASHINSSGRDDVGHDTKASDLGLHPDYVGLGSNYDEGMPLYGLNVHYTRVGASIVSLGLLRDTNQDRELSELKDMIERRGGSSVTEMRKAYEKAAAPFAEPFEINEGDLLIFQARHHHERGLTAVAHKFTTISDTRRADIFHPQLGSANTVQSQRNEMIAKYQLADMGYAA